MTTEQQAQADATKALMETLESALSQAKAIPTTSCENSIHGIERAISFVREDIEFYAMIATA